MSGPTTRSKTPKTLEDYKKLSDQLVKDIQVHRQTEDKLQRDLYYANQKYQQLSRTTNEHVEELAEKVRTSEGEAKEAIQQKEELKRELEHQRIKSKEERESLTESYEVDISELQTENDVFRADTNLTSQAISKLKQELEKREEEIARKDKHLEVCEQAQIDLEAFEKKAKLEKTKIEESERRKTLELISLRRDYDWLLAEHTKSKEKQERLNEQLTEYTEFKAEPAVEQLIEYEGFKAEDLLSPVLQPQPKEEIKTLITTGATPLEQTGAPTLIATPVTMAQPNPPDGTPKGYELPKDAFKYLPSFSGKEDQNVQTFLDSFGIYIVLHKLKEDQVSEKLERLQWALKDSAKSWLVRVIKGNEPQTPEQFKELLRQLKTRFSKFGTTTLEMTQRFTSMHWDMQKESFDAFVERLINLGEELNKTPTDQMLQIQQSLPAKVRPFVMVDEHMQVNHYVERAKQALLSQNYNLYGGAGHTTAESDVLNFGQSHASTQGTSAARVEQLILEKARELEERWKAEQSEQKKEEKLKASAKKIEKLERQVEGLQMNQLTAKIPAQMTHVSPVPQQTTHVYHAVTDTPPSAQTPRPQGMGQGKPPWKNQRDTTRENRRINREDKDYQGLVNILNQAHEKPMECLYHPNQTGRPHNTFTCFIVARPLLLAAERAGINLADFAPQQTN